MTGGRIVTAGGSSRGVIAADLNAADASALPIHAGGVTVTTAGCTSCGFHAPHLGTGSLDVDPDDVAIFTAGDEGLGVVGNMCSAAGTAAIAIDAVGNRAIAVEEPNTAGIFGLRAGPGSVGITRGAGTVVDAPFAVGTDARATNDAGAAGMVTGDVPGLGGGDHRVTVAEGGSATGTVRLAAGP